MDLLLKLTIRALQLFSFTLLLSSNAFAAPKFATKVLLNAQMAAERSARGAADTAEANARSAADTAETNARIATENALSAAITASQHAIGDQYGGGIVFFVNDGGHHGLIAAKADQNGGTGIQWRNGVNKLTGTIGDGIGAGAMNTVLIVATQINETPGGNFAAKVTADFSVQEDGVTPCMNTGSATETCYGDWYLPSKAELNLLFQQRGVVRGFAIANYWSSAELDATNAWGQHFGNGGQVIGSKDNTLRVRAVRAF